MKPLNRYTFEVIPELSRPVEVQVVDVGLDLAEQQARRAMNEWALGLTIVSLIRIELDVRRPEVG